MKLLVVSAWFPCPPDNGVKLRAHNLLLQLARRHRVSLVTFAHPGDAADGQLAALATHCADLRIVQGSPVIGRRDRRRHWFSTMPRSLADSYSTSMQGAVDAMFAAHDAALGLTQWCAPYLMGRPTRPRVLDELELTMLAEERREGVADLRRRLTWWKQARFARKLAGDFDRLTVVSAPEREAAAAAGCDPARVAIVPNGVPADLLDRRLQPPLPGRLVYPGAVTYGPNLDAVTWLVGQILPGIQAMVPGATLHVTGATTGVAVEELAARPGVRFTGRLQDIHQEVAVSAVCVVPLRIGGGTRLKILEALALGVPVVSTSKGAEGLGLVGGRDLLIADTPEAFAAHVVGVCSDASLRQRLIDAGRRAVAGRFTWDIAGAAMERALEEACRSWSRRD